MGRWQAQFTLDGGSELPLFLQLSRAIAEDIRRGRLGTGDQLPSSRALADQLSLHRNTVLAAYRELKAEGYIDGRAGQGTFVVDDLPPPPAGRRRKRGAPRSRSAPGAMAFSLAETGPPEPRLPTPAPGTLTLYGGLPDLRLLPTTALSRAYRRSLRRRASLNYGDPSGHPELRRELAAMLSARRGLSVSADQVLVTRGSQMALALAARALLQPGDKVAVEQYGYPPVWHALRGHGAELIPVRVDRDGLDVEHLADLCAQQAIKAVYLTPHHQYPTTVALSPGRRMALLELAQAQRMAILEDDYDHEFHYESRPLLPLASADRHGSVVYVGTLSKVLAPGLRIGYLIAPEPLQERVRALRVYLDRQGDQVTEGAVAELLSDGELQRHLWRTRRVYRARRDACVALLQEQLADTLEFTVPGGGMALWCRSRRVDAGALLRAAEDRGVSFQLGAHMRFDGRPDPHLRLGYACLTEEELGRAVSALTKARRSLP